MVILSLILIGIALLAAISVVYVTKKCISTLRDVIDEFRMEQKILGLQKQILTNVKEQIGLQQEIIEKQLKMAMNTIKVMELMKNKEKDPAWMDKFHQGRDNAKNN